MVNKTADCFNNIVLVVKISRKNLLKKWKTTQRWKRSYECLSNFLFQSGFSQKDDEEQFDHSEKFAEKKAFVYGHFLFYLFCRCLHLSCQISIESVQNIFICSLNILITVLYLKFFSIFKQFIFY